MMEVNCFPMEFIQEVMYAYCHGLSVLEISDLVGAFGESVNKVIDTYNELFLEGWL